MLCIRWTGAALATSCLLVAGCGGGARGFDLTPDQIIREVSVVNDNRSDVVVYALVGPTRYRLGMVTAKLSQVFEIPEAASLETQDLVILLQTFPAIEGVELGPIIPTGGTAIQVVIAPVISQSRILII